MLADWESYDASGREVVPEQFVEAVETALDDLRTAVDDEDTEGAAEAAVELDLAALDVVMTHGRLPDPQRIGALERRRTLEKEAGDEAAGSNTGLVIGALQERADAQAGAAR